MEHQLAMQINEPVSIFDTFKPAKPPSLVWSNPVYVKSCPNCNGAVEVRFKEREATCLHCSWAIRGIQKLA